MAEKDIGVDVIRQTTVQLHELGQIFTQPNGRKFRYTKSTAAIALGDVLAPVAASGANFAAPVSAADAPMYGAWPNEGDGVGRSRTAITAANVFFWALVGGDALVKAAATVVAGAPIASIATAGTVDDTTASAANALAAASGVGGIFLTTTSGGFARVAFNG